MKLATLLLAVALSPLVVAAADKDDAKARKELLGTWKGRVQNGATGHELTFTKTRITGKQYEEEDLGEGSYTIDRSKKPWRLDGTYTKGPEKGTKCAGIYSLKGDTLMWCVNASGSEPPKKFETAGSSFLLVLKRQKK